MEWKPDKLLHVILIYVIFSGFTYWLPTIRGLFDGPSYSWSGWMGIGGTGVGGQYWFLLMLTALMTTAVFFGWRGIHKPFRWLLLIWFILLVIESGSWFFSTETVQLKGDTLGIELSLGKIIFPFDILFWSLSCLWLIRNIRSNHPHQSPSWTRLNRNLLLMFFCLLPLQFIFLRFFDHNKIFDQMGVFLTIGQWILLNLSFYPWKSQLPRS
jgi:hypothetical protein